MSITSDWFSSAAGVFPPAFLLFLFLLPYTVGLEVEFPKVEYLPRGGEHGLPLGKAVDRPHSEKVGPGQVVFFCAWSSTRPRSTSSSFATSRPKPNSMAEVMADLTA